MTKFLKSNNSLYVLVKKPLLSNVFASLLLLSVVAVLNGCVKGNVSTSPATTPTITTNSFIMNITSVSAESGGIITTDGGSSVLYAGVCYSATNSTPTTANSTTIDSVKIDDSGTGTKSFVSKITGLSPSTTYYIRAYATNNIGTAYGSVTKITTSANLASINTTVTTLAGSGSAGNAIGTGTAASFYNPQGVVTDAAGNVYVADSFNNLIKKITPSGVVSIFAGDGQAGFRNGAAAQAEFYSPQSLAIDGQGNIYVAEVGNNVIRKITAAGSVSTYSGNGIHGYVNGVDSVAEYNNPQGICIDASGIMYVADRGNNVIRKITAAGVVSTFAGYYGYPPTLYDATGTSAIFNTPNSVAVDTKGNLYVADLKNFCIRKITTSGAVVTTLLGNRVQSTLIGSPAYVTVDAKDNLYIADVNGRVIEFNTSNSSLYILAGTSGVSGYKDGAGASALFSNPQSVAIDNQGNVYVADYGNNVIRKIVSNVTSL